MTWVGTFPSGLIARYSGARCLRLAKEGGANLMECDMGRKRTHARREIEGEHGRPPYRFSSVSMAEASAESEGSTRDPKMPASSPLPPIRYL